MDPKIGFDCLDSFFIPTDNYRNRYGETKIWNFKHSRNYLYWPTASGLPSTSNNVLCKLVLKYLFFCK